MSKYKGYSKQPTSDKMMRIIKRERILAMIIANGAELNKIAPEEAEKLFTGIRRVKSNKDWQFSHTCGLTIKSSDYEFFNWKLDLIEECEWLKNFVDIDDDKRMYFDTRKLRIFYKWMHKSGHFYIENVLKYMYSPMFPAILMMECGQYEEEQLILHLQHLSTDDRTELVIWFEDIFGLHPVPLHGSLWFGKEDTSKLIHLTEDIIKQVPSIYNKLLKREVHV